MTCEKGGWQNEGINRSMIEVGKIEIFDERSRSLKVFK
jgi:hypothetical protein